MSATSKVFTGAIAVAVFALSAAALSPAGARGGEHYERNSGTHYHTITGRKTGHRDQQASDSGVFSDAVSAGQPEVLAIKRRKWTPGPR